MQFIISVIFSTMIYQVSLCSCLAVDIFLHMSSSFWLSCSYNVGLWYLLEYWIVGFLLDVAIIDCLLRWHSSFSIGCCGQIVYWIDWICNRYWWVTANIDYVILFFRQIFSNRPIHSSYSCSCSYSYSYFYSCSYSYSYSYFCYSAHSHEHCYPHSYSSYHADSASDYSPKTSSNF